MQIRRFFIILMAAAFLSANPQTVFAQAATSFTKTEIAKWKAISKNVTIIRDKWGIPHIYGNTDAEAVFGLLYAQCEDDFKRVELNYIEKLGRLSELRGEGDFYNDLIIRLLIDTTEAKADYARAEPWLKKLLQAYADGINYYLYTHPAVKPALLTRFEPWFPMLWTDGSIGAISTADITAAELKQFYPGPDGRVAYLERPPDYQSGSNGFAISGKKTASGNAILYINPHVTFYFRPEVHMVSKEGLNAYGAVTWGQFFIYQGFNPYCGWMHTSANVDVADLYAESIIYTGKEADSILQPSHYHYDDAQRPLKMKPITIQYRNGNGLASRTVNAYFTHHGPVMAAREGKWLALKSYNRSAASLKQSWLRTKAKGLADYKKVMDLKANTSNSTVFADHAGNIAYWHGNYIPVRDPKLDWSKPVDGSLSSTEYKGLHTVDQIVHIYNPANGWIQNCNSTPFTVSGSYSPDRNKYPSYMAPDGENFRGINAVRVLSAGNKYTIDKVIAAGYDRRLAAFDVLIPALTRAFDNLQNEQAYASLKSAVDTLRHWSREAGATSVATTLAIEWAQKLNPAIMRYYVNAGEADQVEKTKKFAATATHAQLLEPLREVLKELEAKWGRWNVAWGDINRFQRTTGALQEVYNDSLPSLAVPFASALWGQLPSYNSRYYPGTKKRYGVSGNSFVCAVEFGKTVKAKSLLAGGESGDPRSPHFFDQGKMYTEGRFKDVLFYKPDVLVGARRSYRPGE